MIAEEVAERINRAERWALENEPVLASLSRLERRRLLAWAWLHRRQGERVDR